MDKNQILKRLTVLDFIAVDLQLYLDTHPEDMEAIDKYNSVIKEADMLRMKYEEIIGPLYSFRSSNKGDTFKWIETPWPWQQSANFQIEEDN